MRTRGLARRLLVGTGPLKRVSDRIEMVFRLLLMAAVMAAAPVGILQATTIYDDEAEVSPQEARDHQAVRAVVVADPPAADALPAEALVTVPVAFTAPDGTPVRAAVPVWATTRAQDRITVWVSVHGRLTGPPEERPRSVARAVWEGTLIGLTLPVAAWTLLGWAHVVLEARRLRQWRAEWVTVEPLWTYRRH